MPVSRRQFLKSATALSLGFAGLHRHLAWGDPTAANRFGPLVADPESVLNLPEGFSYQILSQVGDSMDDGLLVPGKADGMAAFPGPKGRTLLVRNHESKPNAQQASPFGEKNERINTIPQEAFYDRGHGAAPRPWFTITRPKRLRGNF